MYGLLTASPGGMDDRSIAATLREPTGRVRHCLEVLSDRHRAVVDPETGRWTAILPRGWVRDDQ